MNREQQVEFSMRADDLNNLLDHIAWENTIKPSLDKYRTNYQNFLVKSVLGQPIIDRATNTVISKEMLAGRIEGIDWLNKFLESVLRKGNFAKEQLEVQQ